MRYILFYLLAFLSLSSVSGQLLYPVVGKYNNKTAQAMAIWKETAYVFNDGGHCRVFDLRNCQMKYEFDLSSADKNNHVNAANFGFEKKDGSVTPYLYVTEYNSPSRCFVEKIGNKRTDLVQIITAQKKGKNLKVSIWCVDSENRRLYCLIRNTAELQTKGYATNTIIAFRLPLISEGKEILLSEKDILSEFVVPFPNGVQDAVIREGYMYIASGLQQSSSHQPNSRRAIRIIDLKKKVLKKTIDLTLLTTNEPEGIDFFNNKMLLFCGQEGGIYKINK